MFLFSPQILSETFIILRGIQRDMTKNVYSSARKVPVIRVRFELQLNIEDGFSKNNQLSNFMKFRPLGADGQT